MIVKFLVTNKYDLGPRGWKMILEAQDHPSPKIEAQGCIGIVLDKANADNFTIGQTYNLNL